MHQLIYFGFPFGIKMIYISKNVYFNKRVIPVTCPRFLKYVFSCPQCIVSVSHMCFFPQNKRRGRKCMELTSLCIFGLAPQMINANFH